MANHAPRAGKRFPKTLIRELNEWLKPDGLQVVDWGRMKSPLHQSISAIFSKPSGMIPIGIYCQTLKRSTLKCKQNTPHKTPQQ